NWESIIDRDFSVEIKVEATNRPGALAEIAAKIGDAESNIEQVSVEERDEESADLTFLILVKDRVHLARVIRSIRHMSVVRRVTRTCT
ncbi:MAG: ACT domain-containing protein, partial [Gammaproteobacteria bacterium]